MLLIKIESCEYVALLKAVQFMCFLWQGMLYFAVHLEKGAMFYLPNTYSTSFGTEAAHVGSDGWYVIKNTKVF